MTLLAYQMIEESGIGSIPNVGYWLAQAIGAICLFGIYLPVTKFLSTRKEEREAFYKAETLRRLAESSTEAAKETIALLRAEERMREIRGREGMKIGGVVCIGVGLSLTIFLYALYTREASMPPVYLVGLIPVLVGASLLTYVFFLSKPVE